MAAKFMPAIGFEDVAVLDRDFFQRLDAIRGKARRDDGEILHPALGQSLHRLVGVGLEPLRAAKARLEGEPELLLVHAELFAQQPRGLAQCQ